MLKKVVLNKRKRGLTREAFAHHWRNVHGRLLASLSEYPVYALRYTQDLVLAGGIAGGQGDEIDGVTIVWQTRPEHMTRGFAESAVYKEKVQPDEDLFLDTGASIVFFADTESSARQEGGTKLILLLARPEGSSHAAFLEDIAATFKARLEGSRDWHSVSGWARNAILPETVKCLRADSQGLVLDEMLELRFADRRTAERFVAAEDFRAAFAQLEAIGGRIAFSFLTEETVIFAQAGFDAEFRRSAATALRA